MWRKHLELTAALLFGFILTHLVGEGGAVKVWCRPGERVSVTCPYHYEDSDEVPQLSVQWRGPHNNLLCHFIKHRSFQNCSEGYSISYAPRSITLGILRLGLLDLGLHVCSVMKPHEFTDSTIELIGTTGSVTSQPKNRGNHSDGTWKPFLLLSLCTLSFLICK